MNRFPLMWQISLFYSFFDFSTYFFTCHSFPERRGDSLTMFIIKRIQNGCEDKANCADIKAKRFCRHYPETHNSQSSLSSVVGWGRAMTQSPPPPPHSTWLSTSVGRATPGNGRARARSPDWIPFHFTFSCFQKKKIFSSSLMCV